MRSRTNRFQRGSVVDLLLLRERLGLRAYRKSIPRDPEEKRILLDLALAKITKAERSDFLPIGNRRRRVKF